MMLLCAQNVRTQATSQSSSLIWRISDRIPLYDTCHSRPQNPGSTARCPPVISAVLRAGCADARIVSVITQFLTDRLEDEAGLKEVANGLMALLSMQRCGSEEAEKVTLA